MGNAQQVQTGGGTGGGIDLTSTDALLQAILNVLDLEFQDGQHKISIDYITIASAGVVQRLYQYHNQVRRGVIQNISAVNITLFAAGSSAGAGGTTAQGIILNASGGAGSAGGSLTIGNIDLYYFWWVGAATGALAVYYEI